MNIKKILLGCAAALAFVPAANAADAIVAAEPEPAEYVRVCDAFGTGYFYIPGTETCLKIGGYVRHDLAGGDLLGLDTDADGAGDAWYNNSRFSLQVSTAADTEFGALKTYVETRFNYNNADNGSNFSLNFAYIDLAGFRVGKTESAFVTFPGYIGNVINDDLIPAGPYDAQVISYTYDAGNGFSGIISLEDDSGEGEGYIPDVVAGVGYSTDAFGIKVVGGYDESLEEGAIKARVDGSFGMFSAFLMAGWNTDGTFTNRFATWEGDWAVWGGASANLTESVALNGQLAYDDAENFAANLNVAFTLAPGFAITPEVAYYKDGVTDEDAWGGMVRFQRSF